MKEGDPKQKPNGHAPEGNGHELKPNGEGEHSLNFLEVTEVMDLLGQDGINQAIDANADLENYTGSDFATKDIKLPEDPVTRLKLLLFEYVSQNPELFQEEMTISGRTLRYAQEHNLPVELVEDTPVSSPTGDVYHPVFPHAKGDGLEDAMDTTSDPIPPVPYNDVPQPHEDTSSQSQETEQKTPRQEEFEILPETEMDALRQAPSLL